MIMEWDWWWCPVCSACWQLYRTGPRENRRMMGEPLPSSSGPKIAEVLLSLADCPSVFLRDRPCGPVVCLDNGSAYVIPVMCSRLIDLLPFQSVALSHVNLSFFSISISRSILSIAITELEEEEEEEEEEAVMLA